MNDTLTIDEFNALELISKLRKNERPNACIGRNSKRLNGLKYIKHNKDGSFDMTEKGFTNLVRQKLYSRFAYDFHRSYGSDRQRCGDVFR